MVDHHTRANARRGEIEAQLGGKTYRLCLTLGALAELEQALDAPDMIGVFRFRNL